jgi:hypothetical protein
VDWFRDADKIPLNPPLIKGEAKVLSFNKVGSENRFLFQRGDSEYFFEVFDSIEVII